MMSMTAWEQQNQFLVQRGIDESTWCALNSTIYPGAKAESIVLAVDYCKARGLDIMLKPVHLVPMSVKNAQTGQYEWRDVPMPGIGLYRIQAERSGTYAGADAPEFGPDITETIGGISVTYPEWCKYTVHKLIGDRLVSYSALEYWKENYATAGKDKLHPNVMWSKRPRGQLAKCAEAQALRKAWPEIGQQPTADEMGDKGYVIDVSNNHQAAAALEHDEVEAWTNALEDITTVDDYQLLRSSLLSRYGDKTPNELKSLFGRKLNELKSKELNNVNS